jgi:hypothetical protein
MAQRRSKRTQVGRKGKRVSRRYRAKTRTRRGHKSRRKSRTWRGKGGGSEPKCTCTGDDYGVNMHKCPDPKCKQMYADTAAQSEEATQMYLAEQETARADRETARRDLIRTTGIQVDMAEEIENTGFFMSKVQKHKSNDWTHYTLSLKDNGDGNPYFFFLDSESKPSVTIFIRNITEELDYPKKLRNGHPHSLVIKTNDKKKYILDLQTEAYLTTFKSLWDEYVQSITTYFDLKTKKRTTGLE